VGEKSLDLDGSPGDFVSHRKILECLALNTKVIVLGTVARAVEDLKINDRTGPNEAAIHVRCDGRTDRRLG
jgi:hypothetical protein